MSTDPAMSAGATVDGAARDAGGAVRAVRRAVDAVAIRLAAVALRPAYAVYVRRLRAEVTAHPVPEHIAVIMDGNRRWAARSGHADPGFGHRAGAEKALELVDWCAETGVREVTLWALSLENLSRSADEVGTITDVATDALGALASGRRRTKVPIHLRVIGRRDVLPENLRGAIDGASAVSREDGAMTVTVALGYSGRDELLEAFRASVRDLVADGVAPEALAGRDHGGDARGPPVHRRVVRPGPHHPDVRRDPPVGVPAVAERVQRVLLLRRVLAGVPGDRLPPGDPHLPAATSSFRAIGRLPEGTGTRRTLG